MLHHRHQHQNLHPQEPEPRVFCSPAETPVLDGDPVEHRRGRWAYSGYRFTDDTMRPNDDSRLKICDTEGTVDGRCEGDNQTSLEGDIKNSSVSVVNNVESNDVVRSAGNCNNINNCVVYRNNKECRGKCRWRSTRSSVDCREGVDSWRRWLCTPLQMLRNCRMDDRDGEKVTRRRGSLAAFLHTMLFVLATVVITQARMTGATRYETAYACEGKTLKIECRDGEVINLIRANYGRFSITICNDHGNTDWSVNCMSTKSLRVLHTKCSMNQNCSILASTSMFGDPCPNTLKYLEAHYTCIPAATTSSTFRPSPPWLITSQPSVWRSTSPSTSLSGGAAGSSGGSGAPAPGGGANARPPSGGGAHHLAPPTFRPHITMPPDLRPGVIKQVKNDGHSPESGGKPSIKVQPEAVIPPAVIEEEILLPEVTEQQPPPKSKDSDGREGFTESMPKKGDDSIGDRNRDDDNFNQHPQERDRDNQPAGDVGDGNWRHRHHPHPHDPIDSQAPALPLWRHCSPTAARGLQWNWTAVGEVAVQPCPGGATGLARWRCVSTAHRISHLQQQKRLGAPSRETLSGHQSRSSVLLDALGAETLLTGRDMEPSQELTEFRENSEPLILPDPMASSLHIEGGNSLTMQKPYDGESQGKAVWISESPDLSECRSVWLNSLETRVREGESLLSISNDLSQVTSSKTLYGGDMMTTTNIMKKLAQRMAQNIQSFPDTRQREAIVTDLLLGVVKTGSNLLDISQQASWKDLSHPAQMRVATSLLIGLEENAFLLAEAVLREKTIVQQVKNILLSVRVLETRNVETEEFPSALAREQWTASQDSIYLPRGALIDNSEGGLVRIVFVAFDRLEEILQPPSAPPFSPPAVTPPPLSADDSAEGEGGASPSSIPPDHQQINKDRDNVTRVINSKVISASLGKGRHIQLSQPVRLTLRHLRTENVTNPTCVFWDYTVNVWSAEGCRVEWSNATHTGCQCVHLTNFALLMDVRAVPLRPAHRLALHLLTVIGCALSALALLAAIIVFHCFRGMKSDRITIHKNLCACLLIAELIFMFGIERTANRVMCGVIAALLHYFFLAAFAWMFLEGFQLYAMLVEVFEPERARARWYYPAAYIVPLIIVIICGAVDSASYGTDKHCWLRADNYFILGFVVPVAIVLLANWICLCMVIYMMCHHSNVSIKAKENNKLYKIKVWLRSSIFLVVLLGLTWTFGLLYLSEETVVFAYLFTAFNSLQGLFIFIFHCLLNETFQKECGRLGQRHRWLACCARLAPAPVSAPATGSASGQAAPTGSVPHSTQSASSNALGQPNIGTKGRSSQRQQEDLRLDDPMDGHGQTRYTLKHQEKLHQQLDSPRSWNTGSRPTAPLYTPTNNDNSNCPTPHSLSMPSINNQLLNNQMINSHSNSSSSQTQNNRVGTPVPIELQLDYNGDCNSTRSRSPSCFSVKMAVNQNDQGWGVVQNPLSSSAMTGTWKSTSSKHQPQTMSGTLQHSEHLRRDPNRNQQRHHNTDSLRLVHNTHQRQQPPHHYHPHSHHTYSEIGRVGYRRGSENEFHDDPVYEEIERNETLMSDMSDDNSGHGDGFVRQIDPMGHPAKFYGDHRPLISYSPGERHRYDRSPVALEHQLPHGKYNTGRWGDSMDRHADRSMYGYHPQEANMRTLAAVLKDNDVTSKVLCPGHGHGTHQRVLPPYSDC